MTDRSKMPHLIWVNDCLAGTTHEFKNLTEYIRKDLCITQKTQNSLCLKKGVLGDTKDVNLALRFLDEQERSLKRSLMINNNDTSVTDLDNEDLKSCELMRKLLSQLVEASGRVNNED